jgi:hypothetical protein
MSKGRGEWPLILGTPKMSDEAQVIGRHVARIIELMDDIRADLRADNVSFEIKVETQPLASRRQHTNKEH